MFRTIVTLALLILLGAGCWMLYKRVNGEGALGAGNVYVTNPSPSTDGASSSSLPESKPLEETRPTPSRSDDPGTINTEPVANYNNTAEDAESQPTNVIQPITPNPPKQLTSQPAYVQPQVQQSAGRLPYTQGKPLSTVDTFAPDSPNGAAFSGTGKFEVYRQGDLTFRMNTESGESCVLYATMEEWHKPIVYSHGCGSHGLRIRSRR